MTTESQLTARERSVSSARHPSFLIRHPAWVDAIAIGLYFALLGWVWWDLGKDDETLNFTTPYFLFANFVVVWWYAWLTRGILHESRVAADGSDKPADARSNEGPQRAEATLE